MLLKSEIQRYTQIEDIFVFDSIGSTNDYAKTVEAYPAIIVSEEQTNGRGQRDRSFFSPKNGIYLSIVIENKFASDEILRLTPIAAVAVCDVIKNLTKLEPKIKWVNDIYIDNKKVCGILTEALSDKLIIGIGINLYGSRDSLPPEICDKAGFLFENKPSLSRNIMISEIFNTLYNYVNEKDFLKHMLEYKNLSFILNKEIKFKISNKIFEAFVRDIDMHGGIVLETDAGLKKYYSGEIVAIVNSI